MNTVPETSTEAAELRALLARIAEVLDVPADGDIEQARILARDRAILVRHAALMAADDGAPAARAAALLQGLAEGGVE